MSDTNKSTYEAQLADAFRDLEGEISAIASQAYITNHMIEHLIGDPKGHEIAPQSPGYVTFCFTKQQIDGAMFSVIHLWEMALGLKHAYFSVLEAASADFKAAKAAASKTPGGTHG